ncbi:hypothetical protein MTO96_050881 [Rhipicephalus appendiculatus]
MHELQVLQGQRLQRVRSGVPTGVQRANEQIMLEIMRIWVRLPSWFRPELKNEGSLRQGNEVWLHMPTVFKFPVL